MSNVEISQNLRPLKFAYIVRPNDFKSLEKIISTNSFLWGARYNPVLPLFKRTPSYLKEEFLIKKIDELLKGNLNFFEPDFLVVTGDIQKEEIQNPPCEIIQLSDIYKNIAVEGMPGYGIGLWELASDYYREECRFVRRNELKHYLPVIDKNHRCFLKAVFGNFPEELHANVVDDICNAFEAEKLDINISNYISLFKKEPPLNIHNINSYKIKIDYTGNVERERHIIFYLDQDSFVDIIDYINLKAAGYVVLPISRSLEKSDEVKNLCLEFIEDHAWVHHDNPHAKFMVTMQKSRTVSENELKEFCEFISPSKFEDDDWPKCMMSMWLPAFWSRYDQEHGRVNCIPITVAKKGMEVPSENRGVRSRSLSPDFLPEKSPRTFKARYANDIRITTYSSKTFEAGIYPNNSNEVARAAGLFGLNEWLIKNSGLTKLCKFESDLIFFDLQTADKIFISWLESQGWTASISDAGKVAYQMLKHLGGPGGIIFLQGRKLIEFIAGSDFENDTSVTSESFLGKVKAIYNDHLVKWGEEKFLKAFFDYNIVQLGTTLQCDVCARRSWHPIDDLNYTIKCPHCLDEFEIPSHKPREIKWPYKTIGPFSARGKGAGAYCVLLTAKFFTQEPGFRQATTTILSFIAEKGDKKLEADLALFYREASYFNRSTELIFCECKIYKRFSKDDVARMRRLAEEFPGAILVFSTLNEVLSDQEKNLLRPFVNSCNKYYERDRPRNPVMILTSNELLSFVGPPYCWKGRGERYKPFEEGHLHGLLELCQATQKIYLDIETWWKSWEKCGIKDVK
jgi:hypothetical protein